MKSKSFYNLLWLLYHSVIIALFCVVVFLGNLSRNGKKTLGDRIDADLFNMLPKQVTTRALAAADDKLLEKTAQNLFILVSNKDFNTAKEAAIKAYDSLKTSDRFKSITLYQDTSNVESMLDFLRSHKELLLTSDVVANINSDGGESFKDAALDKIFSSFNMVPLDLEGDPFCLTDECATSYMDLVSNAAPDMSLKDDVLAKFNEETGLWYIMIRAVSSKAGAALASPKNAVAKIYEVCNPLEKDGTRFIYSGTMFHSYSSSTNATREIGAISAISLTAVVIILLFVFQSTRPILMSLFSIVLSVVTAFCATIAVFGKMHILTLVFGTSLIGSCIDYSLHFFIAWKANKTLTNGAAVRAHLLKGLTLSLVSTVICYFVLLFAPFGLLRQMSVFSMAGIISTYLTAICIYPLLKLPKKRKIRLLRLAHAPHYNRKIVGRVVIGAMFFIGFLLLAVFHKNVIVKNDVKTLYKIAGRELTDETEAAKVLQYNPTGWFILSSSDTDALLEKDERLAALLKELNKGESRAGFVSTATFVPSKKSQMASLMAVEKLLPYTKKLYESAGYSALDAATLSQRYSERVKGFISECKRYLTTNEKGAPTNKSIAGESLISGVADFFNGETVEGDDNGTIDSGASGSPFVTIDSLPSDLRGLLDQTWLGVLDGKYYSVIMPVRVSDNKAYSALAKTEDGIYFINKVISMNDDLDALSQMIIILFAVVYVVLFIVLKLFYTLKQTCKIISVPVLIILAVFATFAASGIAVEFFSITGMILVFGLGLDYVIYMIENEKRIAKSSNSGATFGNNNKNEPRDEKSEGALTADRVEALQLEPFAIMLSFATTALSFGALAASKFIPVHNIGLAIFIGLVTSYISTYFYTRLDAK